MHRRRSLTFESLTDRYLLAVDIVTAPDGVSFVDMGLNLDTGEVHIVGTENDGEDDVAKVFKLNTDRTEITSQVLAGLDSDPLPQVFGISSDGTRIAGASNSDESVNVEGVVWSFDTSGNVAAPTAIGFADGQPKTSRSFGAWSDGLTYGAVGDFDGRGAITWTESTAVTVLPGNPAHLSRAVDVSADGSVIVGDSSLGGGLNAVYWDASGLNVLDASPGIQSQALAISPSGEFIGGWIGYLDQSSTAIQQAVVWDGSRTLARLFDGELNPLEGIVLDVSDHGYAVGVTLANQGFIWHDTFDEPMVFEDWLDSQRDPGDPELPIASNNIVAIAEDTVNGKLLFAVNGSAYFVQVDAPELKESPDFTFYDPQNDTYSLTARNLLSIQEPGVPISLNGSPIDANTYQVIDLNDKLPTIHSFPTTITDIIANTFVRASYQNDGGTTGSLTTSVVASPSFRTDDGTFRYIPEVSSAAVVTNGPKYYQNTLTADFPGLATLQTTRTMSDPVLGETRVQIETDWQATSDINLSAAAPFPGSDRLREVTVSSMFSSETEFDANLIRFEDAGGTIHSLTLTDDTPRDSHLFNQPIEIGRWFELAKTTDSTWEPDSPTTRVRILNDDGVRLGLQGFLAASLLTSDDSLTVWLEDLDSPDVIPSGTQRRLQFEVVATPPVPYDFGDAPDDFPSSGQGYATQLADDGPRHALLPELRLGSELDGEADGVPSADATADDTMAAADEDGVRFIANMVSDPARDTVSSLLVESSAVGKLDAWIDFNRNGDFDHPAEHLSAGTSIDLTAGENLIAFDVPAGTTPGQTFARFRLSSAGSLSPQGMAGDGEVEDYRVTIDDASAGMVDVRLNLPPGQTEIVADGSDFIAIHGTTELIRTAGGRINSVNVHGTPGDDVVELGLLDAAFGNTDVPITIDGAEGLDSLRLSDSGQDLPLETLPAGRLSNLEVIDIRGDGANRLSLDHDALLAVTDAGDTLQVFADPDDTVDIGDGWTLDDPQFIDGVFFRVLTGSTLMLHGPAHWQNPAMPLDVTGDGDVFPIDALILINAVNAGITNPLPLPTPGNAPPDYLDPNGDGNLFPIDILNVINFINAAAAMAEAELDDAASTAVWLPVPAIDKLHADAGVFDANASGTPSESGLLFIERRFDSTPSTPRYEFMPQRPATADLSRRVDDFWNEFGGGADTLLDDVLCASPVG